MSSRLFTTAAMLAAVACNTTNEGSASVKGTVNGKPLQAQSALFVSTAVPAVANGNTIAGDSNGAVGSGGAGDANGTGNMNATLPLHAGAAGQSLLITVSSQSDVCAQAGDNKQPANADYLVLSLVGTQAITAGTYNLAGGAAADANNLLPGNLTPSASVTGATTKAFRRALRADPVADANTLPSVGDANTVAAADTSVVATANYVSVDAKCGGAPVAAKSGTVTLSQVDATGTVEGTFNVTLSTGDVLTGSFKAQSCAPLMSSNAAPYSCN